MEVIKIKDIVDTALDNESFSILCKAVNTAGLEDDLRSSGPFTVFAPTNEAFAKLPKGSVEALLEDKEKLISVLKYHVVPGKLMISAFKLPKSLETLQGQKIRVDAIMWHISKYAKINDAKTIKTDIECTNGIIHAIDLVLMPE